MSSDMVPDWLAHRASALPSRPAIISGERTLTFRDLDERVVGLAGALLANGIRPGDRVGVLCQNSLELVEAIHAIPRLGAVLVLLNCRLTPEELVFQLHDAEVSALLYHGPTAPAAKEAARLAQVTAVALPLAPSQASDPAHRHGLDEAHSIIYTSGTTGRPKGAILTYGNFLASAAGSAFNAGVTPDDCWLACMPLFHVGGLSIVLRSAIYGTSVLLQPGFDERAVMRALRERPVTHISVVATMLQRMLEIDARPAPPALRVMLAGGGPVPIVLLERALELGYPVMQTYGLTEATSQVATLAPVDARSHAGSAGKPLVTTSLRIDAPPAEPGEILVSGPTVTPGYFRNPEATARAFQDGWLRTGDVGRLDEEGFLFVLDRRDDLIVSGGENVYPAEVEAVLLAQPGVREAAVFGIEHPAWGQVVAASLVADATFDEMALEAALRERLAGYKVPRIISQVPELPKTASGKIQRRLARDQFEATRKQAT